MVYLATEMHLYLLSAAAIGVVLGWLIWGVGRRRKLGTVRRELLDMVESERAEHHETKLLLEAAETRKTEALEDARAEANQALVELRQTVDVERLAAQDANAEVERLRAERDELLQEKSAVDQEAIDRALMSAKTEKAAAAEALAKEAQSRAQIEELRLLIGAEKLAAESARSELEQMRTQLRSELEAERSAHEQAKVALVDIRATLARAFGGEPAERDAEDDSHQAAPPARGRTDHGGSGAGGMETGSRQVGRSPSFNTMTDVAAAGDALNNPDLDEADIEDREDTSLDLSSTIEAEQEAEDSVEIVDATPAPVPDKIELRPLADQTSPSQRPASFLDWRPADLDNLTAINGIDAALERRLNDYGCYRYRQLAELKQEDIDWLARALDLPASRIASDRWVEQATALQAAAKDLGGTDQLEQKNAAG